MHSAQYNITCTKVSFCWFFLVDPRCAAKNSSSPHPPTIIFGLPPMQSLQRSPMHRKKITSPPSIFGDAYVSRKYTKKMVNMSTPSQHCFPSRINFYSWGGLFLLSRTGGGSQFVDGQCVWILSFHLCVFQQKQIPFPCNPHVTLIPIFCLQC